MTPSQLPTISVIMPSYNQGEFIQTAIESVLNQDYPHLECLVIDAGSTDETHSILQAYNGRLKIVTVPGLKQSQVMNCGLELAQGEIVAFLNADDVYLAGACRAAGSYLLHHPEVDMIYGDFHIIDESGRRLLSHRELGFHYPSYLFLANFVTYPTVFFRRRIYRKIGLFDTSLDHAMDYDHWLRIARYGQVRHISQLLASYRWHPKSKSILFQREARLEGHVVRKRYLPNYFAHARWGQALFWLCWCFYRTRRVILKLVQGKYWAGLPQPFVFYFWKRRLVQCSRVAMNQRLEGIHAKS